MGSTTSSTYQADIVIPDAVLYEATHDAAKLGAQDIIDWVKPTVVRIELAPTQAFAIFEAARENMPKLRQPDLGERAAVEVIEEPDRLTGNERAVLLCEESAVLRRHQIAIKGASSNSAPWIFCASWKRSAAFSPLTMYSTLFRKRAATLHASELPRYADAASEAIRALLREKP